MSATPEAATAYPYDGPEALRAPVEAALRRVVDPEVALNIVDIGLVYGVRVDDTCVQVRMTMTSAACPVTDLVVEEAAAELAKITPGGMSIDIALVWEPPWSPERMSERARAFMGW